MRKVKITIISVLCCLAIAMTAMAFNISYSYAIGPNETSYLGSHVMATSTIYLNTRPSSGGDVTISLSGGVSGSATFPYRTSRDPWRVTGVNPNTAVQIRGTATSSGSAGVLSIWSN